jgi:peptidoglycan/xylan/chitin deacetylase (PgdA/CDA1 family)
MKTIVITFLAISLTGLAENFLGESKDTENLLIPGLLLTFDDRNMLNWEKQIPLFAKYDAHVTFFVDHFDELTSEQLKALQKLKEAGHAIGCHGLRHIKAVDYCDKNSVEKYISDEILPAIEIMQKKGFPPNCFAYPQSNSSEVTDAALLKYFYYLRSGCSREKEIVNTEKAFVKIENIKEKSTLYGISFHPKLRTDDIVVQVKCALDRIKRNKELLVLYAHDIRNENEKGSKNFITIEALEEILDYAKRNQIKLYSYDELP